MNRRSSTMTAAAALLAVLMLVPTALVREASAFINVPTSGTTCRHATSKATSRRVIAVSYKVSADDLPAGIEYDGADGDSNSIKSRTTSSQRQEIYNLSDEQDHR